MAASLPLNRCSPEARGRGHAGGRPSALNGTGPLPLARPHLTQRARGPGGEAAFFSPPQPLVSPPLFAAPPKIDVAAWPRAGAASLRGRRRREETPGKGRKAVRPGSRRSFGLVTSTGPERKHARCRRYTENKSRTIS